MRLPKALWVVFYVLIAPATVFTLVLFYYPLVFGCAFPEPRTTASADYQNNISAQRATSDSRSAPFRLLALGDPQLEGDSSLPDPNTPLLPSLHLLWREDHTDFSQGFPTEKHSLFSVLGLLFKKDIPSAFQTYRKRLDLLGNDYYLNHIYRTLDWYLEPTHVAVLGDLIGSQWVSDAEFGRRKRRFWNRVIKGGRRVGNELTTGRRVNTSLDDATWRSYVINVAGNHDIGYAGDITNHRVARFEEAYGKVNWEITFTYPELKQRHSKDAPAIRLVVLNDMNLDGPAYDTALQTETYDFLEHQVKGDAVRNDHSSTASILLTHIPLHKAEDVCVDGLLFEYGSTGLREQNHLSYASSAKVLGDVFNIHGSVGSEKTDRAEYAADPTVVTRRQHNGLILTGHDHEGCQVLHHIAADSSARDAKLTASGRSRGSDKPGPWYMDGPSEHSYSIPEVTVRSMMGSYGGNAGLVSGWFDADAGSWRFAYDTCALGVQHWWWAVHVLGLATWCVLGAALLASSIERLTPGRRIEATPKQNRKQIPKGPR